jgi:transposase
VSLPAFVRGLCTRRPPATDAVELQRRKIAHRPGALERVALLLQDWNHAHRRLADTEQRMMGVLDELGLTEFVTSITGLSAIGAAAILAETGDPCRFATARALVKYAGLAPREKLSGTFTGRTKLTGQGRPGLRLAAPDQQRQEQALAGPGPDGSRLLSRSVACRLTVHSAGRR